LQYIRATKHTTKGEKMGILGTLNINKNEVADQEVFAGNGGVWESNLYDVIVQEAYLFKTQNGLTKLQIKVGDTTTEDKSTFEGILLLDADGNPYKAKQGGWTSTDKLTHLITACGLEDSDQKEGVIKMGDNEVKVIILSDVVGKQLTVGVRKCEDDYKETVPYINAFEQFFTKGYANNPAEKERADAFLEMIKKAPIKKKKAKKASAGTTDASSAQADIKNLL
jgi:hypothetical protein